MGSNLKPLLLHGFPTSPNPLKIGIALELLKLPYNIKVWEFGDDPRRGVKSAAFAELSENGRVPVLEDPNTGIVAWESGAVMNYLRRGYDKDGTVLGLTGKGSGDGGEVTEQDLVDFEKWEYLLLTTLGPMIGQMVWFR
jgi:glutathione S-transferase